MKNRGTLEVLRHTRHDWLNKIQLIKANMSMKRWDRVNSLIDEIVLEANQESNLTNLQAPLFAEYLITYHWEPRVISLEYEVVGTKDLSSYDFILYEWISAMLSMLEKMVSKTEDNLLFLSIQSDEKEVRFFFEISGIIENKAMLITWMANQPEHFSVVGHTETSDEFQLQLSFSCE